MSFICVSYHVNTKCRTIQKKNNNWEREHDVKKVNQKPSFDLTSAIYSLDDTRVYTIPIPPRQGTNEKTIEYHETQKDNRRSEENKQPTVPP